MEFLIVLALLACPVGMGLMMWFMGKTRQRDPQSAGAQDAPAQPKSVEQLREGQHRLEAEIARREDQAEAGR